MRSVVRERRLVKQASEGVTFLRCNRQRLSPRELTSGILAVITVQLLLIMLLSAFLLLSNQSTAIILPEHERANLIRSRRQLFAGTNVFENASHDG